MRKIHRKHLIFYLICLVWLFFFLLGCAKKTMEVIELKHYPINSLEGVISRSRVEIDKKITSDGNGSIRIITTEPITAQLYEIGDIDIEKVRLIYQAKVRTEAVDGSVYLEMWCHFPGQGEYFSRGLDSPLTGSNEWSSKETVFFLKEGENPDNIKLNIVINGKGTVWIDDIRLVKGPMA